MASGLTPTYLLPYPLATDPVNVHGDFEDLSTRLEDLLVIFPRKDQTNTFEQPNIFSVNSTSTAVRITQTGTGNALVVEDAANPDTSAFVIDQDGNVAIGNTVAAEKLDVTGNGIFSGNVTATNFNVNGNVVFEGTTADDFELTLAAEDPTSDVTITLPASTDTLVGKETTDVLSNKTINLDSNTLTGTTAEFNTALSDDDFATINGTETLNNKTLESPTINNASLTGQITGLELAFTEGITFEGTTEDDFELRLDAGDPTADRIVTLPDTTDTLVGKNTADELTNKTISILSNQNTLIGSTTDFDASIVDDRFVFRDTPLEIFNKTIDLATNSIVGTTTQFNSGMSDDDFVTLTGTETLINKTLTSPTISDPNFTGKITGIDLAFSEGIVFEGTTDNDFEVTLLAGDPTADRTITLPDFSGTVVTTGNLEDITNLTSPTISNPTFTGQVTGLELAFSQSIVFEGTTENDFELTLTAGDPTADRVISLPDVTGTVITTGNLSEAFPDQTGNTGFFLTTDGTSVSWAEVDALPDQTGNSGKFLTTDGTTATWATVELLPDQTGNAGKVLTTDGTDLAWEEVIGGLEPLDTAPANPTNGQGWYDTTTGKAYVFYEDVDSGQWVEIGSYFAEGATIPSVVGNANKYLFTDGLNASWADVEALPEQTNNSGKLLTTDGTNASWSNFLQSTVSTIPALQLAGSFLIESDNAEGSIFAGDISSGISSTDQGILFLNEAETITSGLFTEVDGEIISYGINVTQITDPDPNRVGGIFRLDTRSAYKEFVVISKDADETGDEKDRISIKLDSGDTYLVPEGGNVGIGTVNPVYKLQVNGSFAAVTKSFVIDHPTKENKQLQYAAIEGPENGVYVRGTATESVIELPDYWTGLVHEDSITVNLTPVGKFQGIYVEKIEDNKVYIGGDLEKTFYTVYAERKDVDRLVVEYDSKL